MVIPLIVLAIVLIAALLFFLWLAYQRGWIFGDGAPPASKQGLGEPSNSNASTNSKPSKPRGGRQQEETSVGPSVSRARPIRTAVVAKGLSSLARQGSHSSAIERI